jgi:uncharacterized delta-60 repeat protein
MSTRSKELLMVALGLLVIFIAAKFVIGCGHELAKETSSSSSSTSTSTSTTNTNTSLPAGLVLTGTLDPTFGNNSNGIVSFDGPANATDQGYHVYEDPSTGNLYVVGILTSFTGAGGIWCYDDKGVLNPNFASVGYISLSDLFPQSSVFDGHRLLVTGYNSNIDMEVRAYDNTGQPDTSFAGGHFSSAGPGGKSASGYSILVDDQKRGLVAGSSKDSQKHDLLTVWRFTSAGQIDTSFYSTGVFTYGNTSSSLSYDEGRVMRIDSKKRIVILGTSIDYTNNYKINSAIWRLNPNGGLDSSFNGGKGYVVIDGNMKGLAIDSQDRVLITGVDSSGMLLSRYNEDGTLDKSANSSSISGGSLLGASGRSLTLDGNGGAVVVGEISSINGSVMTSDMLVWRFNPDLSLDTNFNGQGYMLISGSAGATTLKLDEPHYVITDHLGRIVATGSSRNGSGTSTKPGDDVMVIWRIK